jgi:hypothetical protein
MLLPRLVGILIAISAAALLAAPPEKKFPPEQLAFFEKEVLPVLKQHCYKCHGEGKVRGGLRMTSREGLLKGGDLGPAVSLDKPDSSRLLEAIHYKKEGLEMPPAGKLPQKQIDVLARWVKEGVPMSGAGGEVVQHPEPGGKVTPEAKNYWAYKPVRRPQPPAVRQKAWVRNPIDAFLLARLEEKGLTPAAPADRVALARRAFYDLIGLPPTPAEVDAFVNDTRPDAWELLIDSLLSRPQYGEKWGRHWLDLVRYAETNGYERDGAKPHVWRFRDYVIRSFNDDKPYDRFLREQLAGDEIDRENADCVIATGYYRLGIWDDEPVDPELARYDELDDFVATTSQVFLGMTMNCARCHDHKIDPIPHADYYRLLAFFTDVRRYGGRGQDPGATLTDITPREKRSGYEADLKRRQARVGELTKTMTAIEDEAIKKMPAADQRASEGADRPRVVRKVPQFLDGKQREEYARLKREVQDLQRKPPPSQELALSVNNCDRNPPQSHLLIRGNPHAKGVKVEPGFPQVLGVPDPKLAPPGKDARSTGRRTLLASWIASKDNPLTARVMVNRLWQHHFGRGIVASTNDFGKFGTPPTHPELLDWLASEFMPSQGRAAPEWGIKKMHRLIMRSSAYQMSSRAEAKAMKVDPANNLLWRFNMRRLTAEEVRDSVLSVSGKLNLKQGGPSIYPPISREVLAGQSVPGQGWGSSPPEEASRRSVYVHIKRSLLVPILTQHDQADTDSSCPVRYTTTVPTQALGMLNGEFTNEQAEALATRLRHESPDDLSAQVKRAIRLTTGRTPTEVEVNKDVAFVRSLPGDGLRRYCLLALNTNEFIYLD